MEERATIARRSVKLRFEASRNGSELLADAFSRLAPGEQGVVKIGGNAKLGQGFGSLVTGGFEPRVVPLDREVWS